jgi:DNA polymerase-3 subunit alpha
MESMIKVGVFDAWGTRPQILDALDRLMSYSGTTHDAAAVGQMSLFGGSMAGAAGLAVDLLSPSASSLQVDQREILDWEKELVGVYISEHPLSRYLELASELASANTAELIEMANNRGVSVLGLLTYLRTHVTKKGDSMAFGSLEDLQGTVELIFFPRTWKQVRSRVELDRVYLVMGKVRTGNGDRPQIIVERIQNDLTVARPADLALNGSPDERPPTGHRPARPTAPSPEVPPVAKTLPVPEQKATQSAAPKPATTTTADRPATTSRSGPPPPPNFEPDDAYSSAMPASRPATVEPSPAKPRPPAATATPSEPEAADSNRGDTPSLEPPTATEPLATSVSGEPVGLPRVVVVHLQPDGAWRETCRQVVQLAGRYAGHDSLLIRVSGQPMAMEFPNLNTCYCPELIDDVRRLPAIVGVEAI